MYHFRRIIGYAKILKNVLQQTTLNAIILKVTILWEIIVDKQYFFVDMMRFASEQTFFSVVILNLIIFIAIFQDRSTLKKHWIKQSMQSNVNIQ